MTDQVENTYQSLRPLERAQLFHQHIKRDGLTKSAIAEKYDISLSYVSNTMRLLKLPELVQEGLMHDHVTEGHARALVSVESIHTVATLYRTILVEKLSVRKTEQLVREHID